MTHPPPNAGAVLREARKRLSEPGVWMKRRPLDSELEEHDCALTVIGLACPHSEQLRQSVGDKLRAALPGIWRVVGRYNDHPATTHADILALYDRAIALADSEGGKL